VDPTCEDQGGSDDEHQVEHDDQGTKNPNEQVVGETYGVGPSAGNVNEYVIPMSAFDRLMINRLDNMASD